MSRELHDFFPLQSRSAVRRWRTLISAGLVVAYLVLVGDAVRCQYFSAEHEHHGGPESPRATSHATHCVLANHGSATIPSIGVSGIQPLPLTGHTPAPQTWLAHTPFAAPSHARAPPAV